MILELVACTGLMWILKHGSILNIPRNYICSKSSLLKELFNCSLCLGFWVGLVVCYFCYFYIDKNLQLILLPFASSAVCWFFDSLLDVIQLAACKLDKKN